MPAAIRPGNRTPDSRGDFQGFYQQTLRFARPPENRSPIRGDPNGYTTETFRRKPRPATTGPSWCSGCGRNGRSEKKTPAGRLAAPGRTAHCSGSSRHNLGRILLASQIRSLRAAHRKRYRFRTAHYEK